ncbi:MAG TPA: TRAP transporter small permease [Xanthobacteraceae bacterium]|nr:TRAP transporter small permease [Xanthobacteraceae bacterium]
MMVQISADVLFRAVVGQSLTGTVEIVSHYYMVGVSFLPIAYAEIHNRHIEATVFTDLMPRPVQNGLRWIALILSLIVYGLLTYATAIEATKQTAIRAFVESGTMRIVVWPSYWILPVSFGLMCIVLVLRLVRPRAELIPSQTLSS